MEQLPWQLLERYHAGECTPEEADAAQVLLADPVYGPAFRAAVQALDPKTAAPSAPEPTAAYDRLRVRLRDAAESSVRIRKPSTHRTPAALQWGGAFLLATIIAFVAVRRISDPSRQTAETAREYRTAPGQRATVTLADGTTAMLAPATKMSASTTSGGTIVVVDGEAEFAVAHDSRSPFTVRAGGAIARVLGTRFLVRKYAGDRAARVLVTEGRVAVLPAIGGAPATVLSRRMLAIVPDSGSIRVSSDVSPERFMAWTRGELMFSDTPVRDVLADIGRAYDVDIRLADTTLASQLLTWTVPTERRSLDDVLSGLNVLLDTRASRAGRVITISKNRSARRSNAAPRMNPLPQEFQYGR